MWYRKFLLCRDSPFLKASVDVSIFMLQGRYTLTYLVNAAVYVEIK